MKKPLVLLILSLTILAIAGCSGFLSGITGNLLDKPLSRNDGTDANVYVTEGKPLNPPPPDPSDEIPNPGISVPDPFSLIGEADWPDNAFTRLIPKPSFTLISVSVDDDSFTAAFRNATLEQVKAYAESVRAAGFTVDSEVREEAVMGVEMYSYTASNSGGYTVTITLSSGIGSIGVTR
ncbi:MAG: hypothetical protein ILO53_00630 [Clostridia bacterium]|nr:hypothetical protein [Clostridia bacterium]